MFFVDLCFTILEKYNRIKVLNYFLFYLLLSMPMALDVFELSKPLGFIKIGKA